MKSYDHKKIEPKWQEKWQELGLDKAADGSPKPKYFCLVEFPYPSGDGLHIGHVRSFTAIDIVARKKRLQGFNVLYPMGWDAFGLPAENYAIKTGQHPRKVVENNVAVFKKQCQSLGLSFDWDREVNTTDPEYYKWTQWIFLQLYKKGLAYKNKMGINWCPSCKIGLANEEVVDGGCERCGAETEKRELEQWMLKITEYADRLIEDLETVDYLDKIKTQQVNWIGRSYGAEVDFQVKSFDDKIRVFTTRPDTLFGATFMVLSPEHELVNKITTEEQKDEVFKYKDEARKKSDLERTDLQKDKSGVFTGAFAINPVNGNKIPIWIADYVLSSYGTGAIMAVPAHDNRDYEFAKKYHLEIVEVIEGGDISEAAFTDIQKGKLTNSGKFSGLAVSDAIQQITKWLKDEELGEKSVNYHLRDWVFSRQHYWGEPIPMVNCSECGWQPMDEKDLPLELPMVEKYEPTQTGESPLAAMEDWVKTECPKCGGAARRETDTMPNWAGSSWYFLRYIDPKNNEALADMDKLKQWMPIDLYNGGMEHTTLHLLYSRFWNKFLYDIGAVPTSEPYQRRVSHGMILASDGQKMSKSRGNVINPDSIVEEYGADVLRLYEMFMGPYDQSVAWDLNGVRGIRRFVEKLSSFEKWIDADAKDVITLFHQTIQKVTNDIDERRFNTAVSAMMIFVNKIQEAGCSKDLFKQFIVLVSPFVPHLAEELWADLGGKEVIGFEKWPEFDEKLIVEDEKEVPIQINGKIRAKLVVKSDIEFEELKKIALENENVQKFLDGKDPKKVIDVKGKLISIVI
jgi:leucyl-tRNA synthetase